MVLIMSNNKKYEQIFMDVFSVDARDLGESFTFQSQESWDSLAHLDLIAELEDTFDVFFDSEDILNYGSYLNGKDILRRYGVEFEP